MLNCKYPLQNIALIRDYQNKGDERPMFTCSCEKASLVHVSGAPANYQYVFYHYLSSTFAFSLVCIGEQVLKVSDNLVTINKVG